MTTSHSKRISYIDSLRGLACILVFLCHYLDTILGGHPNFFGRAGVCVFFILSGYCITERYHPSEYAYWSLRRIICFYLKRFISIIPCVYLSFSFCTYIGYLHNVKFSSAFNLFSHGVGFYWTINVELLFYLVWPIISLVILMLGQYKSKIVFFILMFVWYLNVCCIVHLPQDNFTVYVTMIYPGIAISLCRKDNVRKSKSKKDIIFLILFIIFSLSGGLLYCYENDIPYNMEIIKNVAGMITAALMVHYIIKLDNVKHVLESGKMRFLSDIGSISFEIYMVHYSVLYMMAEWMRNQEEYSIFICTVISALIVLMLANFLHYCVHMPCKKFADWISTRCFKCEM